MGGIIRIIFLSLLALAMFYYPQEVLSAASQGLSLWWRFVLPALLPFFILSELLMGQGFVHFLGVLLEPLMRPLFRLPGSASFVLAMAYTSGIPIGAILTAKLREQGELTREEGERLLAFTTNPSPGFMFGALAAGMLGQPGLGVVLAGSVYLANLCVGFLFRFYGKDALPRQGGRVSLQRAWGEMKKAQRKDARPLGRVMGDAISQSGKTLLIIGGFIVFFSVVIHLLNVWQITEILARLLRPLLGTFIPPTGVKAILEGLLETTIGCQSAVNSFSHLNQQVAALSFLLGWGGLSAFAQVLSFTSTTDLRFSAFVIGRVLHAVIALGLSQIFLRVAKVPAGVFPAPQPLAPLAMWAQTWHALAVFALLIGLLLIISFFLQLTRQA